MIAAHEDPLPYSDAPDKGEDEELSYRAKNALENYK